MIPMLTTDTLSAEGPAIPLLGSGVLVITRPSRPNHFYDELRLMLETGHIDLVPLGTRHGEVARHRQAGVGSEIDLSTGVAGAMDHGGTRPSG
jgi:hypothetical protein